MQNLELQDRRYLEAAEGWLGLGNFLEANEELECITPQMRAHPDVLCMRWNVYAQAKKWKMAVRAWGTHIQTNGVLTETEALDAPLSTNEVTKLGALCGSIMRNSSGYGVCTCGTNQN